LYYKSKQAPMNEEREYLCCVIHHNTGIVSNYDIIHFFQKNRYYPGLTGAVLLCQNQTFVTIEGSSDTIIKKFMELTNLLKSYIQIVSSGPLIDQKRTFNSWNFWLNAQTEYEQRLLVDVNQEDISPLKRILSGQEGKNYITELIHSFLTNEQLNYQDFWKGN
jgi:hypothetical protein